MKIVKADAKGRVTGLEATVPYRMEHMPNGRVELTPVRVDQEWAPVVGVASVHEWMRVLGFNALQVKAEDIQIGQLTEQQMSDADKINGEQTTTGFGAFLNVWELDEEGEPIRVQDGRIVEPRLVCIALDRAVS